MSAATGDGSDDAVHGRVQEQLSAYLDGELAEAQRTDVDRHLAACELCRGELGRLRATVVKLGALRRRAPDSFLPDIQKQIFARSRGRFFNRRWKLFGRIPFEWVSLLMILAMLVYYLVMLQTSPTGVTPAP